MDNVAISLHMEQATITHDALVEFIYTNLFDGIVDQVNRDIALGTEASAHDFIWIVTTGIQE